MPSSEDIDNETRAWVDTYLNPCALTPALREAAAGTVNANPPTLAFLPGTGLQSKGLAHAFAAVSFPVVVGSRDLSKARNHAKELQQCAANPSVLGLETMDAADTGDVVFWLHPTVNETQWRESMALFRSLQPQLAGKIVVDVTNILWFHGQESWGQISSTILLSSALEPSANIRLVSAFKHTYYRLLYPENRPPASNPHVVFVCSDDAEAAATVIAIVNKLSGFRGLYAGDLQYSKIVELLSPLWLAQLERDNYGALFEAGWRFGK